MAKRKNKNKISGKANAKSLVYLLTASILIFLFGCFVWVLWMMNVLGWGIFSIVKF